MVLCALVVDPQLSCLTVFLLLTTLELLSLTIEARMLWGWLLLNV